MKANPSLGPLHLQFQVALTEGAVLLISAHTHTGTQGCGSGPVSVCVCVCVCVSVCVWDSPTKEVLKRLMRQ